jgi:uncharacterized protein (DUF2062 family)
VGHEYQAEARANSRLHPWGARLRRAGRAIYLRLVRQNSNPDKVAKGLALGVFLGIFPTFGVGSPLALLASSWLGWNRAAALLGTLIANPLLNPFFLSLSVIAGNFVVPSEFRIVMDSFRQGDWWPRLLNLLPIYLVGNLLVSTLFAALAYVTGLIVVTKYRKRHAKNFSTDGRGC